MGLCCRKTCCCCRCRCGRRGRQLTTLAPRLRGRSPRCARLSTRASASAKRRCRARTVARNALAACARGARLPLSCINRPPAACGRGECRRRQRRTAEAAWPRPFAGSTLPSVGSPSAGGPSVVPPPSPRRSCVVPSMRLQSRLQSLPRRPHNMAAGCCPLLTAQLPHQSQDRACLPDRGAEDREEGAEVAGRWQVDACPCVLLVFTVKM